MVKAANTPADGTECHICGQEINALVKSYKVIGEVELKSGGMVDVELFVAPRDIDLCLNCAVGVALQGARKLQGQG